MTAQVELSNTPDENSSDAGKLEPTDQLLNSKPELGAECHFHQNRRPTPACLITDAAGTTVIASSQTEERNFNRWAIRSVTVSLTRLWSASTATIYLTARAVGLPQQPPVVPRKLHPEQQISIYLGYLEGPRPTRYTDVADNRLIRVFVGVVDTVTAACTGKVGYSLKIQCRDRVRWFMDSSLLFNLTNDENRFLMQGGGGNPQNSAVNPINRAEGIWFILNSAIGRDGSVCSPSQEGGQTSSACNKDCEGCGVSLERGEIVPVTDSGSAVVPSTIYGTKIKGRVRNEEATDPYRVKTNIYVTRENLGDKFQSSFLLVDNSALETIKRLSYMEVYPTEFFQDHHTGELFYGPRGLDTSGLGDPARFYRTYFVRNIPDGMEVKDINQMVLSYKEDISTINLRTNIVVGGHKDDGSGDHVVHLKAAPVNLLDIPHACRYAMYQDQSIGSITEAAYVALAWSREQGKMLRSGEMTVIGDPSWSLGEVVQTVESPLQFENDKGWLSRRKAEDYQNEREQIKEWVRRADDWFKNSTLVAQQSKEDDKTLENQKKMVPGVGQLPDGSVTVDETRPGRENDTDVTCRPDVWVEGSRKGFYKEDLPTMWRVDAIVHHFKSTGYVTQLYLGVPF